MSNQYGWNPTPAFTPQARAARAGLRVIVHDVHKVHKVHKVHYETILALSIQGAALALLVLAGTGCPIVQTTDYDTGFAAGFAMDDWYWQGYDDSYATLSYSPLYYQGSTITTADTPPYDQGYWDGVWYAYNDGYFVCYDYAFTIGFSEGYDAAYYSGYLTFLANDVHVENDNGGWGDGYNDGFSEGRVFGASDYEQGLAFDWLNALLDYRSGTDLNFAEISVGTGSYGPVTLYVYGTDPAAAKSLAQTRVPGNANLPIGRSKRSDTLPAIRADLALKVSTSNPPALSYRTLPTTEEQELDTCPTNTARSSRPLTLTTTWLERVDAYRAAEAPAAKSLRTRSIQDATNEPIL